MQTYFEVTVAFTHTTMHFRFPTDAAMRAFGEAVKSAEGFVSVSYGEAATRF